MKSIILFLLIVPSLCYPVPGKIDKFTTGNRYSYMNLNIAGQNLHRAIAIADSAVCHHFTENGMARYYNPYTGVQSEEKASVWMYTSAIEAVNAILRGLNTHKKHGGTGLYEEHFGRYIELLDSLYANLTYYRGRFTLTSYTQTREWSVYGVDRGRVKEDARVEGIYNVYDDQQWLVREMLESYKITGNSKYLQEAKYLTSYVLDG